MPTNPNKQPDDFLDEFFDEIVNGLADNKSVREFSVSLRETLNRNGYSGVGDMVNKGIDTTIRNIGPDAGSTGIERPEKVVDGFTFVQNELANYHYDLSHRGGFKDGHMQAIKQFYGELEANKNNIQSYVTVIKDEIRYKKRTMLKDSRFTEGYLQGLKDLLKYLDGAKHFMMAKVKRDMNAY